MPDFPNLAATDPQSICFGTPQLLFNEICVQNTNQTTFDQATGAWPTANLAIFVPMPISMPFTVVKMFLYNGGTVSGNVDIGIYTAEGARVVSSGTTAHAATTDKQVFDITDTLLNPGLYYLALAFDNNVALVTHMAGLAVNNCRSIGIRQASSSFVLPATVTFEAAANAYIPDIYLTGNSVI